MPPILTAGESREQAELRWLKHVLLAIASSSKDGAIRIPQKALEKVRDVAERQALFEDRDKNGDVVLRFGSKHSAVYTVEGDGCTRTSTTTVQSNLSHQVQQVPSMPSSASTRNDQGDGEGRAEVVPPKTQATINRLQETIRKQNLANRIVARERDREREMRMSVEQMIENIGMTPEERLQVDARRAKESSTR